MMLEAVSDVSGWWIEEDGERIDGTFASEEVSAWRKLACDLWCELHREPYYADPHDPEGDVDQQADEFAALYRERDELAAEVARLKAVKQ